MLSYALMDETIGTLHPRVDVYVENFEDSGRNKVLFKEKLPLGSNRRRVAHVVEALRVVTCPRVWYWGRTFPL